MSSLVALALFVASCWEGLPEILPLHRMAADNLLRMLIQRHVVVNEAEFHAWGRM